ncbi:biotin transporter BioY [Virgibacillus pantothenticus]|uniref:Biotin transporter n=1 Tax=Virgibacillus pantothenticus TaxID=1473 RepID=A0A0L0QJI1_VIRPA|nr:biotin transporter BioY [Virgibacillus pantothenticus]KNE18810.1 biotin synthase [Virgibacillus pantothenticus]MED3738489.1 biotin transporter BioY [Virgibacillus pantothenticus]QTY15235.1 biotin transporter BioY [Virgibacillus pantothenticus]SIS83963.1 biotin transport system substrate-specific component [Virgibacillus pantothenticus]
MDQQNKKLRLILNSALFAALTAILAQIDIPLPLIPISGQTLAVGITATILGSKQGALAMICYAVIGAVGAPVFAGFSGGAHVLVGPSGGYVFGFIVTAYVTGWILEKTSFRLANALIANIVGMVITLAFGTVQLKFILDYTWNAAFLAGVYPFIAVGIIKAVLASWIGIAVRKRLVQANLILETKQKVA